MFANQPKTMATVPHEAIPDRADRLLAELLKEPFSRSGVARLIRLGRIKLSGRAIRPSTILKPGDVVEIDLKDEEPISEAPEPAPLVDILFEDDDLIVVNKPPGLVVHPGAGRPVTTLVDTLVSSRPEMVGVGQYGRWGVVHRLDKDTSGVMVVAKSKTAYHALSAAFKEHSIHRVYLALVRGEPSADEGIVDKPLGRHAKDRKKISTATTKPRAAITRWKVLERLGGITMMEITPETGRTHQIRVHLASIGLPVAGDPVYGRLRKKAAVRSAALHRGLESLKRQALHAAVLGFTHPRSGEYLEFSAPMPEDMATVVSMMRSG
ncbi:MAG: RluA family pseudouridine synthase [Thermodesulfobacteriota bacterium]